MSMVGNIIEMFVPFLKVMSGRIFLIPPVLGYTLVETFTAFAVEGCKLSTALVPKAEADVDAREPIDIFIIDQALENMNDPLITADCLVDTIRTINIKYGLGTVAETVKEGFDYMTIDSTDDNDVFTIFE